MRIELSRLRTVDGSARGIGRAIAETLAANGAEVAINASKEGERRARVIGEIRGTVPSGRLVRAPGDAAGEVGILFNDVGT
jgi:NAD(P)-dependent dehydrogenase (short-subunit alcohol dehydrogenase family)